MADLDNQPQSPTDGPEEKAASLLNGVMVMLLASALTAFAFWGIADFMTPILAGEAPPSWRDDVVMRLLLPIVWLPAACSMFFWGFRMLKPKPAL